jgi:hypothetical protein
VEGQTLLFGLLFVAICVLLLLKLTCGRTDSSLRLIVCSYMCLQTFTNKTAGLQIGRCYEQEQKTEAVNDHGTYACAVGVAGGLQLQ